MSDDMRADGLEAFPAERDLACEISICALRALPAIKRRLFGADSETRRELPLSLVSVLVLLDRCGAMPVSKIGDHFGIARPNITPIIDRLIEPGYVMRQRDEKDRRVTNIVILPPGRDRVAKILEAQSGYVARKLRHMKHEHIVELYRTLDRLCALLADDA